VDEALEIGLEKTPVPARVSPKGRKEVEETVPLTPPPVH